jgi:hypothetical protein
VSDTDRNGTEADEPNFGPWATEMGKRAVLAFRKALPTLLKERPRQWVAFHGDEVVGFARTPLDLYQECARRGLPHGDYIVQAIEPEPPPVIYLD